MTFLHSKTERRILPRWRSSRRASKSPEFTALKPPKRIQAESDEHYREVTHAFEIAPTVGSAAETLAVSVLAGNDDRAKSAATFLLANEQGSPRALLDVARAFLREGRIEETEKAIGQSSITHTRSLLRLTPNNPMLWSDMARHFASEGERRRALRCMQTAQHLAPNHRWLLRAMSRFLVHQGDRTAAHKLLANHPRTSSDPWLIAAELACAQVAGRAPKFWRRASDILKAGAVPSVHVSELATAVAMMELEAGERKRARKYVQKGLLAPTENTLAQVFWAADNKHLGDDYGLDELVKTAEDAYEAEFKLKVSQGQLLGALESAQTWKDDEPFAGRPRAEIAYVASLLDDHDLTMRMADEVVRLDGRADLNLEMNRIFAVLSSGALDPSRDIETIGRVGQLLGELSERKEGHPYHALANLGLWHYRYGNATDGRRLYLAAIDKARKVGGLEAAAMAATFAAREAVLSGAAEAGLDLQNAKDLVEKSKSKVGEFYIRKLDALVVDPKKASEILSPKTAKNYLSSERQPASVRFEKTSKGYRILLSKAK